MNDDRLVNAIAEAGLLGAMLLDNRLIVTLSDRLRAEDFGDPLHGRIFTAMMRFAARGQRADAVTLRPVFQNDSACGYGDYLDGLVESPAAIVGAPAFAEQIVELAARRHTRSVLHRAMESLATEFDRPVAEIVGTVEEAAWAAEIRTDTIETCDAADMIGEAEARDDRILNDPGSVGMANALISDLDALFGPAETGLYKILASRPGMGKSTLASSAALGWAINGHPGAYFHAEMTKEQMALRVTSDLAFAMGHGAHIDHAALKKGGLNPTQRRILAEVKERAALLPLRYMAVGKCDVRRIWSLTARHKAMWAARGKHLKFVVVDYLGLLRASDAEGKPIENGYARVSAISKTLLRMAQELDVHVVAVAQLSRAVEARPNKRPGVSDLKESGELEQDADEILLLYREEVYLEEEEPKRGEMKSGKDLHEQWETDMNIVRGKIELIVGKNRHGRRGKRTANFHAKHYAVRGGEVSAYSDDDMVTLM